MTYKIGATSAKSVTNGFQEVKTLLFVHFVFQAAGACMASMTVIGSMSMSVHARSMRLSASPALASNFVCRASVLRTTQSFQMHSAPSRETCTPENRNETGSQGRLSSFFRVLGLGFAAQGLETQLALPLPGGRSQEAGQERLSNW